MQPLPPCLGLDQEAIDRDMDIVRQLCESGDVEGAQAALDHIVANLSDYAIPLPSEDAEPT